MAKENVELIISRYYNGIAWEEVEIWSLFHCLARTAYVMRCQVEPGATPDKPFENMVHSDIKPDNILIGEMTRDDEHEDAPPYKVCV